MLISLKTYVITAVLVIMAGFRSACAADTGPSILSELTRSGVVAQSGAVKSGSLLHELTTSVAAETVEGQVLAEDVTENGELFALDELTGKQEDVAGLEMPEDELPLSDIPLTLNSKVEYFIYTFQTRARTSFARWLSRSSRYVPLMKEILRREGMPEDLVYVAMIESGFQLNARSWASAVGPWQFMSATGRRYALRIDQWIDERKDPVKATTAAALYLKELHGMFNGDWYLAAAGYNAGENKIIKAMNKYSSADFWQISEGSYLKRETKEYVPKLLAAAIIAKDPARYGFSDIAYLPPVEFETVRIASQTDLELVAKLAGTTYEAIQGLNPELRHWCTPPDYPGYELKLPKGTKRLFEEGYANIPPEKRFTEKPFYTRYTARKRDTLTSVARRFQISPQVLAEINGIGRKSRIVGKTLIVPALKNKAIAAKAPVPAATKTSHHRQTRYYKVKKGDTIYSLSRQFKVPARLLLAWNNLKGKFVLRPGRSLIVARGEQKSGKTAVPRS